MKFVQNEQHDLEFIWHREGEQSLNLLMVRGWKTKTRPVQMGLKNEITWPPLENQIPSKNTQTQEATAHKCYSLINT